MFHVEHILYLKASDNISVCSTWNIRFKQDHWNISSRLFIRQSKYKSILVCHLKTDVQILQKQEYRYTKNIVRINKIVYLTLLDPFPTQGNHR